MTHTLEKMCVLATLMFILGRTGFVARLAGAPPSVGALARPDAPLALGFFTLMALTESWIAAHEPTLLNARAIATCAAGLLAGPWIGLAVGVAAGLLALLLVNASLVGYVLPPGGGQRTGHPRGPAARDPDRPPGRGPCPRAAAAASARPLWRPIRLDD